MKLGIKLSALALLLCSLTAALTLLAATNGASVWQTVAVFALAAALSAGATYFAVYRLVTLPLKKLRKDIGDVSDRSARISSDRRDEIGLLYGDINELLNVFNREKAKQSRIIASISHDIKTPLTSVLGYTEFLKNPNLSPERREKYLATVYGKAEEIRDIVVEFDDYLSGNLDQNLSRDFVSVGMLLSEISEIARTSAPENGFEVMVLENDSADKMLYVDKAKLHRVFSNIVSNSVKHSQAERPLIIFSAEHTEDSACITVRDNGKGVKPEELVRVFEPMYTSDRSRSVAGLGLAICKEIVTAHGGRISASSVYGSYFSISVELPLAKLEE